MGKIFINNTNFSIIPGVSYRVCKCFSHLLHCEVAEEIVLFPFSS